jgi:hypothetical protein
MQVPSNLNRLVNSVACFLMVSGLWGQDSIGKADEVAAPLAFRIVATKSTICTRDGLIVEVSLRNISTHPIKVYPQGISAIHFETQRPVPNQILPNYEFLDKNAKRADLAQAEDLITLRSGNSYQYSISLKDDFFKTQGSYKLSLEYDSEEGPGRKGRAETQSVFAGHLESNQLIFQVEECDVGTQQSRVARTKKELLQTRK